MRLKRTLILLLALLLTSWAAAEGLAPDGGLAGDAPEGAPEESGLGFLGTAELDDEGEAPRVRFRMINTSEKTVSGYWILIYGTDGNGATIFGHDDGGWWTEGEILPGGTGYTEYVEIPDDERIVALHTLVLAVAYADGSEWELDTSSPEEAAERGLVDHWDLREDPAE